jgi:7-carboxy-7-deazaguanine synthase
MTIPLKVNEIFGPTIQGEGKSAGLKVYFLRLATCNLHCVWCDTPYTWNWIGTKFSHPKKFDPKVEVHEMTIPKVLVKLEELGGQEHEALVISGGEPLIQQKQLVELVAWLKRRGWKIEIETNGTITPLPELDKYVDQYNCSPKLSNSGDERRLRVRSQALSSLAQNPKVFFKFVVANQKDIDEVLEYVYDYSISHDRVYLMPLGMTREELNQTRGMTKVLCERYGFNFSDRLHVIEFGGVRGV